MPTAFQYHGDQSREAGARCHGYQRVTAIHMHLTSTKIRSAGHSSARRLAATAAIRRNGLRCLCKLTYRTHGPDILIDYKIDRSEVLR